MHDFMASGKRRPAAPRLHPSFGGNHRPYLSLERSNAGGERQGIGGGGGLEEGHDPVRHPEVEAHPRLVPPVRPLLRPVQAPVDRVQACGTAGVRGRVSAKFERKEKEGRGESGAG